jgi:hypothetical protein
VKRAVRRTEVGEPCGNCGVKHRTLTYEECLDRSMSERTLQDRVVGRAKRRGWKVAHAGRAWVGDKDNGQFITPMSKGWPDLTLAKEGHALIFLELKREDGTVDDDQWTWLRLLGLTGNKVAIIRPSHLRDGTVRTILNQGAPLG